MNSLESNKNNDLETDYVVYKKDEKASQELKRNYSSYILPRCCYKNIFHIVLSHFLGSMKEGEEKIKIAYGYTNACEADDWTIFVRHCFLITDTQMVIDPTLPDDRNDKYYVVYAMNMREYLDVILKEKIVSLDRYPPILNEERKFCLWAAEHNMACIA